MNRLQEFIKRIFRIEPARDREIVIIEPHTFIADVIRNKLWYRGDSAELEQYFKKTARWDVEKARFWAAKAQGSVRKMHSGIVAIVAGPIPRYRAGGSGPRVFRRGADGDERNLAGNF